MYVSVHMSHIRIPKICYICVQSYSYVRNCYVCVQLYAYYVTHGNVNVLHLRTPARICNLDKFVWSTRMICRNHILCNTCSLHEVEVTILGTSTVADLFSVCMIYLTHGSTYTTNVLTSIHVEPSFMINVICNVYYYKKKKKKKKKKTTSNWSCLLSVY